MKRYSRILIAFFILIFVPSISLGWKVDGPGSGGGSGTGTGTPYDSNPAMNGTASPGNSDSYARGNHVHPTDTGRQAAFGNQDAKKAFMGPASGAAAAPNFRLLESGDIPDLSAVYVTPGALTAALGGYVPTTYLDTDGTLAANSDAKVASQKAGKTYADTKVPISQTATTLTANSATPALTAGKIYYKTNNSSTTTYTNFTGGSEGMLIWIDVNDANSKLNFSSTNLTNPFNPGSIYTAVSGDAIIARHDGTNWRCLIIGINAPDGSRFSDYMNNTSYTPASGKYRILWVGGLPYFDIDGSGYNATYTVFSGTATLGTSAISSGTCATAVDVTATGVATTDVIDWGFNGDPTGTTGYAPSANGMLTIIAYPGTGHVYFKVCNNTSASITPGAALPLNFKVRR